MSLTTLTLLDSTTYGTPSGNYDGSSLDFVGNPVLAANYYRGQGNIQTVTISVTDFLGKIKLEATLEDTQAVNTSQAAWFEIGELGDDILSTTGIIPLTITGNFTYVRARILGFDNGTIGYIRITY